MGINCCIIFLTICVSQVYLECGPNTKLVHASEPSMCEYEMKMQTPAVCEEFKEEVDDEERNEEMRKIEAYLKDEL